MSTWKRTFWVVWIANGITALGMQSFLPFFDGHIRELGVLDADARAVWTGLIYGAAPLAAALMSPAWGMLGDRFGRKLMVLRAMIGLTVFVTAMAFATTPAMLLALRIGQGIFSGFIPPSVTLVSVGAPPERQGGIAGSLAAAMAIGGIGGPALGALLSKSFGTREVFLSTALLAAFSAILIACFAHEDKTGQRSMRSITWSSIAPSKVLRAFSRDFGELTRSPGLRGAAILLFLVQFGLGSSNPHLERFVEELSGADGKFATGMLFTSLAISSALALPLWGKFGDRIGHRRALVFCSGASAAILLLHALAPNYAWLLVARVALGATAGGIAPVAFGVAAAETTVDNRGAAFGAVFSARAFAVAIGASVGGVVVAAVGVRGLFALSALVIGVSLLLVRSTARNAKPESEALEAQSD